LSKRIQQSILKKFSVLYF